MSHTAVMHPIVAALVKSEDVLGKNRTWEHVNLQQEEFISKYFSSRKELSQFTEEELKSWASDNAEVLNNILRSEGFNIRLQEFRDPSEFGVVSILDVLVEWLFEGQKTVIDVEDKEYPAVEISAQTTEEEPHTNLEVFLSDAHAHPVAGLHTKTGDVVYMTVADAPLEGFELLSRVEGIRSGMQRSYENYEFVRFPMVDLDQEVAISWLKGLKTATESGEEAQITQALQQTKFKMNEKGARVKSAVAIGIAITSVQVPQFIEINKPFYFWIEREGLSIPIIAAYINEDNWQDPEDLSSM